MTATLRMISVFAICFIPAVTVLIVVARERQLRRARTRVPFKELRRRPAGEAIRIKLGELDDKVSDLFLWLALPPGLIATGAFFVPSSSWNSLVPLIVLSLIFSTIIGFNLHRTIRERDNHRLGFDGERFVGEELNRLVAKRFEVYHDVPFDSFNIDHVLVGPPGVYSVETKTRRKPVDRDGNKDYRVRFDGAGVHWPWGTDTRDLDQAARNARMLAEWLSGAVGERVVVSAILTLPGWLVDRNAASRGVHVLNPKEIAKLVDGQPEILNESLIKRICYQLDQKCKMEVE